MSLAPRPRGGTGARRVVHKKSAAFQRYLPGWSSAGAEPRFIIYRGTATCTARSVRGPLRHLGRVLSNAQMLGFGDEAEIFLSHTVGQYPGPCFDLILRSASFAARLMSAAERSSICFASLNSRGLIGRGLRLTPFPSCSARMRNAAIRPNSLSLAGIRYHGANFVDVSSNMSSIATT